VSSRRGLFIAFEGGEASGKSTQAARLAVRIDALLTREPGGTPTGERIRELLLDPGAAVDARAEALLMAAARAQHVSELIAPALSSGRHVVTDRFTASSLAYQGFGRGLPLEDVKALSTFATAGLTPDLTVLLDLDPAVAAVRRSREHDRMEAAGDAFHQRVRDGFLSLVDRTWLVVDGALPPEDVEQAVWSRLSGILPS
jgi:dTMP kinase